MGSEMCIRDRYQVLERSAGYTKLELRPKTGRTHQIRVHLQYLNYPIVADYLYAGKKFDPEKPDQNLGFTRQALHAHKIVFQTVDGEEKEIESSMPQDFIISKH